MAAARPFAPSFMFWNLVMDLCRVVVPDAPRVGTIRLAEPRKKRKSFISCFGGSSPPATRPMLRSEPGSFTVRAGQFVILGASVPDFNIEVAMFGPGAIEVAR